MRFFSILSSRSLTLLILWVCLVSGCAKRARQSETAPLPLLTFEFAGCKRVWFDAVCELDTTRTLTFWVPGNTAPLVLVANREVRALESRLVGGGFSARYAIPDAASEVVLESAGSRATLTLRANSEPDLLVQAQVLRGRGQWAPARELLRARLSELTPAEAMRGRALLARLDLAQGNFMAAVPILKETATAALRDGLTSEAAYDTLALAFVLTNHLHDFTAARSVLERATLDFERLPEARALLPYYKAVLAVQMGEPQAALLQLREALLRAERLSLRDDALAAKKQLAAIFHGLGRHSQATTMQEQLVADSADALPCIQLGNLISLTWFLLTDDQATSGDKLREVLPRVDNAFAACPDPAKRRNHQLNLVYAALERKQWDHAAQLLAALDRIAGGNDNRLNTWEQLFRGRLRAGRAQWEAALDQYRRAETLASASGDRALLHAAKLERARALAARGKVTSALEVLDEVEQLADELVRWVPLGEGQRAFAYQLEGGTQTLIEILSRQGSAREAAAAARRGRLRLLGATWRANRIQALRGERRIAWEQAVSDYRSQKVKLEELSARDWELSKVELEAAVRQREVLLQELRNALGRANAALATSLVSPSRDTMNEPLVRTTLLLARATEDWRAFLSIGGQWQTFVLANVDEKSSPTAWAEALREVFDHVPGLVGKCAFECTLGVIVHPVLEGLDVHALAHRGAPILSRVPVVYVLDESAATPPGDSARALSSALIVGDPNGDLPVAREEALAVAERNLAPRQTVLLQTDATKAALTERWGGVDLLHFSGHAQFGGIDGLESALRLTGNDHLGLADALTAGGSPRFAVLSACDAARTRSDTESGLGMSHALLAAGSEVVVAPNRVVPDTQAARFGAALYSELTSFSVSDWALATKSASLRLREAAPELDWSAYRVHASR